MQKHQCHALALLPESMYLFISIAVLVQVLGVSTTVRIHIVSHRDQRVSAVEVMLKYDYNKTLKIRRYW